MNVQQGQITATQMQHVQTQLEVLPVLVIQAIMGMVQHVQVHSCYDFIVPSHFEEKGGYRNRLCLSVRPHYRIILLNEFKKFSIETTQI
jgi:hypothetical protein